MDKTKKGTLEERERVFEEAMVNHILMSALYSKPDIGILKEMKSMMHMLGLEDHFSGDLAIKNVSGEENLNGVCEDKGSEKIEKSSCVKERVEENLKNKTARY